jgi:hypothetical protein
MERQMLGVSSYAGPSFSLHGHRRVDRRRNGGLRGRHVRPTYPKSFLIGTACDVADSGSDGGDAGAVVPLDPVDAGTCTCAFVCAALGQRTDGCSFVSSTEVSCTYATMCLGGRRPKDLVAPRIALRDARRAYLLGCAHMEAASVIAFERLARALERLEAPPTLAARARTAAREEVEHAQGMLALAGEEDLPEVEVGPGPPDTVLDLALANVREGCVRETFAALLARRQADRALDQRVRIEMARIAADETRHAQLSWDLAAWLDTRLDDAERREVERARKEEIACLHQDLESRSYVDAALGLPAAHESRALAGALFAALAA